MNNLSESSDIYIDDVSKMIGDLEELDNDLLGNVLKKNSNDTQKKVAFEDINDDDNSLYDMLSDSKEIHETIKNSAIKKNSKIIDLFSTTSENIGSNTTFNFTESNPGYSVPPRSIAQRIERVGNEAKPSDRNKKAFMEDLFGTKPRTMSLKDINDAPATKNLGREEELVSASMPNLLKNDNTSKSINNVTPGFSLSSASVKEPRRGRPKSAVIADPLGILTSASKTSQESTHTMKDNADLQLNASEPAPSNDLPEWLGGSKKVNQDTDKRENTSMERNENQYSEPVATNKLNKNIPEKDSYSFSDFSLVQTQFEQSAIARMQQQEHELRTTAILSKQTEQLKNIMESQKNKLNKQEQLFESLVKDQINRQAMLETQIELQQARIDNFIQILMKQPMSLQSTFYLESKEFDNTETDNTQGGVELHNLEEEKNNLEHLLDILKDKHVQEIKILEDSHKMQIHFMQEMMNKLESKLRKEIESLEIDYEKRIEKLCIEQEQQEKDFKQQLNNLKEENLQMIKEIHVRHSEQMSLIKKEHTDTIGNIFHAKELERQTIDYIKSNKTDLETILDKSQIMYDGFQTIFEDIKNRDNESIHQRERDLKDQEATLKASVEQLNKQQMVLENERIQLVKTTQKLESDTSQLIFQLQKNTELFCQREERLAMQEKTLIRERELLQEQHKWEREHLQSLKDSWMTDKKQQIKLLTSEREALTAEKAKMEVLSSLKTNSDDVTKVELEAALAAAHNAAREANRERQKWQERMENLQTDQLRHEAKEKQLTQKNKELEDLTQSAHTTRDEGFKALKEAQRIEKQYHGQISQLHLQLEMLAERETRVAAEKIALARERLALRGAHVEKPEKDVTNDTLRNKVSESIYHNSSHSMTHFKDVVDPQLILLKLNLDNRLESS